MRSFPALLCCALLVACGGEAAKDETPDEGVEQAGEEHAGDEHGAEHDHHASHAPRYGGHLVEIGAHAAQVELVHDAGTGRLTAFVWDGCVENPIRLAVDRLSIQIELGDKPLDLSLAPVADPLTGEKAGDTSRFEAQSDALKGVKTFEGELGPLEIKGVEFESTWFELGESHDDEEEGGGHDEDGDEHGAEGAEHG